MLTATIVLIAAGLCGTGVGAHAVRVLTPWKSVRTSVFSFFADHPTIAALCCLSASGIDELQASERVRTAVALETINAVHTGSEGAIDAVMVETLDETGYNLGGEVNIRRANERSGRGVMEATLFSRRHGWDPVTGTTTRCKGVTQIVPKFAAAVAMHMRTKLGKLSRSEANVLLAQRKYLEICRKRGVRDCDTVMHQPWVMNCFFSDTVMDQVASARSRRSKLMKWLAGVEELPQADLISF